MRLALSLSSLLFTAQTLAAQTPSAGAVTGSVRDSTGAPIANAQVFAIGTPWSALTDPRGRYRIDGIAPGRYDLRAAFVGYRPVAIRRVEVIGTNTTPLDFTLPTGKMTLGCILTVTAERPLVPRDLNATEWTITDWMLGK